MSSIIITPIGQPEQTAFSPGYSESRIRTPTGSPKRKTRTPNGSPLKNSPYTWSPSGSPNKKSKPHTSPSKLKSQAFSNPFSSVSNTSTRLIEHSDGSSTSNIKGANQAESTNQVEGNPCGSSFQRDGSCLTRNEFCTLAHVFNRVMSAPQAVQDWMRSLGSRYSERLSALTGVGENSCRTAIDFADTGILKTGNLTRNGRPKKIMNQELATKITEFVTETNKNGIPNSANLISNELKQSGIARSPRSIRRDLSLLGMHWGKGIRQNILHDSEQNIAYRLQYLKRRLDNLRVVNGQIVPIVPEVFMDESYCHLDHAAAKRWVSKGGVVSEP
ncbi:hypothetical protein BGX26_007792, partial [Mortierella sp. AD094]